MNLTTETLAIFTLLIPGFITSAILNLLVVRREKDALARVIEALVFSFLIYAIASFLFRQHPTSLTESREGNEKGFAVSFDSGYSATVALLAVAMACILGWAINSGQLMKMAQWLRLTTKTGRTSLWLDVFSTQKRYVIVNLNDGRRVYGWPMFYSETPEEGSLYL